MTVRRDGGLLEEETTKAIIGAFIRVHDTLGFGFLESVYSSAMAVELDKRNHSVAREVSVVIRYEGVEIARQRLDMVLDDAVVVEIKAREKLHQDAARQVFNYLRATNLQVGLLLHFGCKPKFYRLVCQAAKAAPCPCRDPPNPPDPRDP